MRLKWLLCISLFTAVLVLATSRVEACGWSSSKIKQCSDFQICGAATFKNKWETIATAKRFIIEAQKRGLTCGTNTKAPTTKAPTKPVNKFFALERQFNKLSKSKRYLVQSKLAQKNLYLATVDGLYGRRTEAALKAFNRIYLKNSDLKNYYNVKILMQALIAVEPIIKKTKPKVAPPIMPSPNPQAVNTYNVASGTGFYVSDTGHIITNHHVIDGCKDIKVHSKGEVLKTLKIAGDRQNDLALLKVSYQPSYVFPLSEDSPYPLQDIVVAGFPFGDRVSSSLKFTKGIVSSLSGIGNNYSEIQIDAALQPGNSGGPIIDEYGNIIAVAVAKLDMKKIFKDYGVIPENTNFGIKASAIKNLLLGNAVSTKPPNTKILSKQKLSKSATDGTVFLSCWMTVAQIEDMKSRKVLFTDLD